MTPTDLNSEVKNWSAQSAAMLRKKVRQLTNKNKHKYLKARKTQGLASSIKYKLNKRFSEVERIRFPYARHGYFIAVGASKGHPHKSNPRKKIEWHHFLFENRIEELANIVVKYHADKAMLNVNKL